jgi:hypothetical protein
MQVYKYYNIDPVNYNLQKLTKELSILPNYSGFSIDSVEHILSTLWASEIPLTNEDITNIQSIIQNHVATASPTFRLTNSETISESDLAIQYDRIGYQKKKSPTVKGELRVVEYFETCYPEIINNVPSGKLIYSNKVVQETNNWLYTHDPLKPLLHLPVMRTIVTEYYLSDDTVGHTKISSKFYDYPPDIYAFINDRHSNILAEAKEYIRATTLTFEQQMEIIDVFSIPMTKYKEGNGMPLAETILDPNTQYLTEKMRYDLINIINY